MFRKITSIFFLFFCIVQATKAQKIKHRIKNPISNLQSNVVEKRTCLTMKIDSISRAKYTSRGSLTNFENGLQKAINSYKLSKSNSRESSDIDTIYIPVIIHIIHNGQSKGVAENISTAQALSQIDVLNEDYQKKPGTKGFNTNAVGASLPVKFVPALIDQDGFELEEKGIHRYNGGKASWDSENDIEEILKPATIFDPTKYLNLWTVKFDGDLKDLLGYAQFPNLSGLAGLSNNEGDAKTDGVVIRYTAFGRVGNVNAPFNLGRTATHEVGHYLGLRHIWGDNSNCTGTDYCNDTPPTDQAIYNCPSSYSSCLNTPAMKENYMDYTNDGCMNIITNDQKTRIMTVLDVSPRRKELKNSRVHLPSSLPSANFSISSVTNCLNNTIILTGNSSKIPSYVEWKIFNRKNQLINNYVGDVNNYTITGLDSDIYSIEHIVGNEFGFDTVFKKNAITILPTTNQVVPFQDNFESSSVLMNQLYIENADSTWHLTSITSGFGTGDFSIFYNNYDTTFDQSGTRSGFVTSKFDFTTDTNAYLTFDVAYATYGNLYTNDSLAIYYTTDCGNTFNLIWQKGGDNLATALPTEEFFVPNSSQWRTEQISLKDLNGLENVNFLFLNISGWANNLYLDNINIKVPPRSGVPISDFIISPTTACPGSIVSFIDQSTQYPTSWLWTISTSTGKTISSTLQNPQIEFPNSGKFNVTLTSTNAFGKSTTVTKNNYVYIATEPSINITSSRQIQFDPFFGVNYISLNCGTKITLNATGGNNYFWFDNISLFPIQSGNSSLVITPNNNTEYYFVQADNKFGCFNYDIVYIDLLSECVVTTSANTITSDKEENLSIYPNPVSNTSILKYENLPNNTLVECKDINGKVKFTTNTSTDTNYLELPTANLVSGIYILTITSNDKKTYLKLIKE